MIEILAFPMDVFRLIVEQLVITIGIRKTVLLRSVCRAFDASILHAICVSQVIDIHDPATPSICRRMNRDLRGQIVELNSRSANSNSHPYLQVVALVNRALDNLINEPDAESTKMRHLIVAGAVQCNKSELIDAQAETQYIFCGAALVGSVFAIESLLDLQNPPDVNGITPFFEAPLFVAAERGHLDVVRYLLDHGARIVEDTMPKWGFENLPDHTHWANSDVDLEVRSMFFRAQRQSALQAAVRGGHDNVLDLVLQSEYRLPTTDLEYIRAIIAAAESGRLDFIRTLFTIIGRDLTDFEDLEIELMRQAIDHSRLEVVKWLVGKGYDVHMPAVQMKFSTLETAAIIGNVAMVTYFLDQGVHVYSDKIHRELDGPVIEAASYGHEEITHLLISHGADSARALPNAAVFGHWHLVRSLLQRFPGLTSKDHGNVGRQALIYALRAMNLTTITLLVEDGVSLNEDWGPQRLPIYRVTQRPKLWVMRHLIALGARPMPEDQWMQAEDAFATKLRGEIVTERTWDWVGKY